MRRPQPNPPLRHLSASVGAARDAEPIGDLAQREFDCIVGGTGAADASSHLACRRFQLDVKQGPFQTPQPHLRGRPYRRGR